MLRFAIPKAPRQARLRQVPGAVRRLVRAVLVGVLVAAVIAVGAWAAGRWLGAEAAFFRAAVPIDAQLIAVFLPPKAEREDSVATATLVFDLEGVTHSVAGVEMDALVAEGLGRGAIVPLLVRLDDPSHPREKRRAEALRGATRFVPFGVGVGALVLLAIVGRELRRAWRRELEPLRLGALVWLTPDGPLPEGRGEQTFAGHYFRDDVKHAVRARGDFSQAPVRKGEQLLAAVVPSEPTWVRVVDEDLARRLGWLA